MNKRGTMFVEAAIVMPIIIMVSLSVVYYSIFQMENFNLQCRIHQELCQRKCEGLIPVGVETLTLSNAIDLGGLSDDLLHKEIAAKKYVVNYPLAVRLGNAN